MNYAFTLKSKYLQTLRFTNYGMLDENSKLFQKISWIGLEQTNEGLAFRLKSLSLILP
jgi:hypothetical protein